MFKNYFKTAWRNLWKNRLFAVVNIVGLSVGFASIIALLAGVYMYYTTDNIEQDKGQMYYLKSVDTNNASGGSMLTTYPLLDEIKRTCPEVSAATHIQQWYYPWLKNGDKEIQEPTNFVDADFFDVFTLPLKYGNPKIALKQTNDIVLSDDIAQKLFGNINPVGKILMADDSLPLTVAGVLQPIPSNSSIKGDVFLTTQFLKNEYPGFKENANWYNAFAVNYVRLKKGASVAAFNKKIAHIVDVNYDKNRGPSSIVAVPFFNLKNENGLLVQTIVKGSVATACFILLIILFNLINLNAASMYNRTKEVAVRKVVGGSKWNILLQFITENALIFVIALAIAALLYVDVLMPQLNEIYKTSFTELSLQTKDFPVIAVTAIISIIVVVIAGSLPALKLLSLPITNGVKGQLSKRIRGIRIRSVFIVLQFTVAVIFICVTIILNRQVDYMKTASLGYDKDNAVVVNLNSGFKNISRDSVYFSSLLNQLKTNPYVNSFSTSYVIPTAYDENYDTYIDPATNREVSMRYSTVDAGYLNTYKIPVIKGRNFSDDLSATDKNGVMINRKAMEALGWNNINNKQLVSKGGGEPVKVIGVMGNFNYQSMQNGIEPLMHYYGGKSNIHYTNLTISIKGNHKQDVLNTVEAAFKQMSARRPFTYHYVSDLVENQYDLLNGILQITNFVAFLTIIISCMGMFALISLYAKQRVKEIGIRKVLGAKTGSIVLLLSRDFILFVALACMIATPVALITMHKWLESFAYRINIQSWMFALAGIIAILIALLTVSFQSIKAAIANPVKSLKTE